ncbi:uncharacterized protein ACLA_075490 [Aspergillus clavatus NRRL 1]|uniref:Uncharacterized protein n=1 Tax=Aspergillus clavatus (strain ATCC 1007 / CBS 513.65 / DSM 816 / NCTC 3887 / NRRL 1 / QM 1276 / 107) TaxID=344612 RepID=A1C7Y9_ASPCL|nr:uncharacterized protein ACLA_075490 [Aspergillus clavatus NRRL 1]EAW14510.1 conserved hypothetical protein [Aspergillus clavatus NRRL 1]
MAFYSNGMNANPLSSGSGFGGHNARFLQASASNGGLPNGTGQPSGGHHRNGQAPRQPGPNNGQRGRRGQRGQHAQKVFIAPAGPRDGDVVMRDAYAPIAAPQPDPDVVMVDAPPLLETASAILDLALNDEALGSTCYQMGGAPFYF